MTERLLKTWCRVDVMKNKTLMDVAVTTSNEKLVRLLERYRMQNEFTTAALACDVVYMRELHSTGQYQSVISMARLWQIS